MTEVKLKAISNCINWVAAAIGFALIGHAFGWEAGVGGWLVWVSM
jgi:hypothetical protein